MNIMKMSKEDFEKIPYITPKQIIVCDSLIILPVDKEHVNEFKHMGFISVIDNEPLYYLSGTSDMLCLNGICGWGKNWINKCYEKFPTKVFPTPWRIDCLSKSGLMRIFILYGKIRCDPENSTFEIYNHDLR